PASSSNRITIPPVRSRNRAPISSRRTGPASECFPRPVTTRTTRSPSDRCSSSQRMVIRRALSAVSPCRSSVGRSDPRMAAARLPLLLDMRRLPDRERATTLPSWLQDFELGAIGSADRVLQPLTGTESRAGGGADLDLLPRAGVPPRPSLALAGFKAPETGDLHLVAGLERLSDNPAVGTKDGVHSLLCLGLAKIRPLGQLLSEFRFVHRGLLCEGGGTTGNTTADAVCHKQ